MPLVGLKITAVLLEQNFQEKPTEVTWFEHLTAAHSALEDVLQQLQAQEQSVLPRRSGEVDSKQAGSLIQLAQTVLSAICNVRKAVQKAFLGNAGSTGRAQILTAQLPHAYSFS